MLELCQAKSDAGAPSSEMVNAFRGLRKVYEDSLDRDPHFDEVSSTALPWILTVSIRRRHNELRVSQATAGLGNEITPSSLPYPGGNRVFRECSCVC